MVRIKFTQAPQRFQCAFLLQLIAECFQRLFRVPFTFFVQQLKACIGQDVRHLGVAARFCHERFHGSVQVVVLVRGHSQVVVQLQVPRERAHHSACKGIDRPDGHIAPVVQHVA